MNVFRYEVKCSLKSTFVWGIVLGILGFIFVALYPGFSSDMKVVEKIIASYPPELMRAFGLGEGGFGSFNSFYSFCFVYIIFVGTIQALIIGSSIIAKETTGKTSDFLFTKPINRYKVLGSKYIAVLVCIIVTNLLYFLFTYVSCFMNLEKIDIYILLLLNGALFFTQLLFLSIGFSIGCFVKKLKSPVTFGIGIGALFFALEMVANMFDDTALKFLSLMSYFDPNYIIEHSSYEISTFVAGIGLTLLFLSLGFYSYKRKDISS